MEKLHLSKILTRSFPVIFSDIDGVLLKQTTPTDGAISALKYIRQPLSKILKDSKENYDFQIPLIALTNGSGILEYQKAEKFINNQEYISAIKTLKNLIDEEPHGYTKADLYNYLGFATRKQPNPDYKLAEEFYLKALEINNNHVGALEYLGELYFETNRLDEAKLLLDRLKMFAGENSQEYKELNKLLN